MRHGRVASPNGENMKKLASKNDIWYHIKDIESKGKLFNFITSVRSCGKTIDIKRRMVERFIEHEERFVYVRRRSTEIKSDKMREFFHKMQSEVGYYQEHDLTFEKDIFYCNEKVMGYATALSTSVNERSVDFVNVKDIYFEEYVLKEDGVHKYLEDEVFTFLELYSTIAREEDVRVWFIGNKITEFNPYFLYFDIRPPEVGIKVWKDFAVETWKKPDFIEHKKKSRFGKLIDGTSYSDYAVENEGYINNMDFKRPLPKRSVPYFRILNNSKIFTCYMCLDGTLEICERDDKKGDIITTQSNDFSPDTINISYFKSTNVGQIYILKLRKNKVFYDNSKSEEVKRIFDKKMYFLK